jgi:hypothetical protein
MDKMSKGLKISSRTNQVLFDSAWIAGVDYDEELFDDKDFETNSESNEEENEDDEADEYAKMDVNEIASITHEPHCFNVPNPNNQNDETPIFQQEEEEIIFEDEQEDAKVAINEYDSEEEYDDSDKEDVSLEADKDDLSNPTLR